MYKYKLKKGWTKAKVLAMFKKGNNGTQAQSGGQCQYLTEDGNKCAVGVFIPEGHESQNEIAMVKELLVNYPELTKHMPLNSKALQWMQAYHDCCGAGEAFESIPDTDGDTYKAIKLFLKERVE